MSTGDSEILQEFHDSYCIEEGHRVVQLLKKEILELSPNCGTAERRFRTIQKQLQQDDASRIIYEEQMLHHVVKQQVELAPTVENSTGVFYLPHHAVKKEHHGKMKWRIVFDASSSEGNSPSLNDVLEMDPNLLPKVLAILLCFRTQPLAIISKVQQTFLQLSLEEKDRELTRFLWYGISQDDRGNHYTTNELVTYRFTHLPFGLTYSPFLLSVTVRELATVCREEHPRAAPLIDRNMFIHDLVAGVDDGNAAIMVCYKLTALMKTIKLPMGMWATSCEEAKEIWRAEGQDIQGMTQALGIDWNTDSDTLSLYSRDILDK